MDWARILGGFKKYLAEYARSFAAAGFNKRKDLYIASGLLSYNASQEMKDMLTFLEPHSRWAGSTWAAAAAAAGKVAGSDAAPWLLLLG